MADHKATVGNVELVSVSDGQDGIDPLEMFPDSTLEQWRDEYPDLLDGDSVRTRLGSVVLRAGGKTVLVDTGIGAPDGTLLTDLARKGVDREAIELVVTTHLHPDHVGWNLSDGRPTFPNARYLVPRADWDYWTQPSVLAGADHVRDQVMPLEELRVMDLIQGEYRITDELTSLPTPGHTPGHISIVISSAGERGFVLGDVSHSPAQAHYTDWSPSFDVDQVLSRETRHKVIDRLEEEGSLVSSGHFPAPGYGRFVRRDGRRVWQGV